MFVFVVAINNPLITPTLIKFALSHACFIKIKPQQNFRFGFAMLCYNPEFETMKEGFFKELPRRLAGFEKILGKRSWAISENLTYVDFGLCVLLDHMELCSPGCYETLPNIQRYKKKFDNFESIKKYRSSEKFSVFPIFSPIAHWGT